MKRLIKRIFASLILAFILTLSIQYILPTSQFVKEAEAATVKINKKEITINVDDTYQLKVSGTKSKVKWSSSKKSIAMVSSDGEVTAKKVGKATITATTNGKKYKCKVTVKKLEISDVYIEANLSNLQLQVNKEYCGMLSINGISDNSKVEWSSSDDSIVSLELYDRFTFLNAHKVGEVTITGVVKNKSFTCLINITDYTDQEKKAAYGVLMLGELLKDPSSLTINNIYYSPVDEVNIKQEVIIIDYTATNGFGGRVRSYMSIMETDEIFNIGHTLITDDFGYLCMFISDTEPTNYNPISINTDNVLKEKTIKSQYSYEYY